MGFGWSSNVAQSTMVSSCFRSGFEQSELLSDERLLLPDAGRAVAVATDDINHFVSMSSEERAAIDTIPLADLDTDWINVGIESHPSKAADLVSDAKTLGINFREGTHLLSRAEKVWTLFEAICDLSEGLEASPHELEVLNGHLQWQNLLNRPLYSCLHSVHDFIHQLPTSATRPLPDDVIGELFLNVCLFPFWSSDLRRPWWPILPATDASPSFGFGLCTTPCSPSLSRAIASAAASPDCVIRLKLEDHDPVEKFQLGTELRLPYTQRDFKPVFAIKAATTSHSGAMEMEGVKLGLLRVCRTARFHSHRGSFLVDAKGVGFALQKGRTSAPTLRWGATAVAAISLAADLKLSFPYLPSESNPADFPSRGKVLKGSKLKRSGAGARISSGLVRQAYRESRKRWPPC
jgi:hypothetical protein